MADKPKIDTGTGGFEIDGKVYTFDVGVPESEGGAQGNVDHGNVKVDTDVKDISKATKVTLAQYLSDVTMGKKGSSKGLANKYPIDPPRGSPPTATEIGLSDDRGNPSSLSVSPPNSTSFAPTPPDSLSESWSVIKTEFKKGKSSAPRPDGNDLLPGISGDSTFVSPLGTLVGDKPLVVGPVAGHPDTFRRVSPYVSAIMSHNRFTDAANAWNANDVSQPSATFNPSLTDQKKLGLYDKDAPSITMGRLAQVGSILTMKAGIELNSSDEGFNANSGPGQASALLPGVAQLAISRVTHTALNAKSVLETLTTEEVIPDEKFISPGSLSWGALNNTEDQWSGVSALGAAALSAALVAGLLLLIDGLSLILSLVQAGPVSPTRDVIGRYALGRSRVVAKKKNEGGLLGAATALLSLDIGSLLGIQPTNYPFASALKKGSNAFFGIDDSGGVLGQLSGAVTKALGPDAGFNTIVARTIIRSTLTIIDQIKKIGGNPINVIKQLLSLIDVLRSSKIISACNVFAQLGDSILTLPAEWVDQNSEGEPRVSQMDAKLDLNAAGRNRLPGTLKLAWANNRAPASMLISQPIVTVSKYAKKLGSYDTEATSENIYGRTRGTVISAESENGFRISTEIVEQMEKTFDAEYVPFYFHDVRTNEMVGFHAFLASLNDDYTANYDSVDAYGRVEPVKLYKGTTRRIGMSFYVASTSREDFDDMWTKINKLVTLVYPQFTSGKKVVSGENPADFVFTQPFSQLIGASPLIRIRLGDLIRSNYSRFGLARLFGLGNADFTLNKIKSAQFFKQFDQKIINVKLPAKLEEFKKVGGKTFKVSQGYAYPAAPASSAGGVSISPPNTPGASSSGAKPKFASQFVPTGNPDFFEIKIVKENPSDPRSVIGKVQLTTDPESLESLQDIIANIKQDYDNANKLNQRYIGGEYLFLKNTLRPTQKTRDQALEVVAESVESSDFAKELGIFMEDTGNNANAVAKSFRDTGGKGLAGFIDTMNFDWHDKVTWETGDVNSVAPRMCKVTLTFSPIHDITPGLDHFGINRAPIYPVSRQAPRKKI
jgi:hypothetical protein